MQQADNKNYRAVALWLWTGAGLVLLMVVIGGITRLTGSGLSMTDWNLLLGAIPPTDHASWMEVFNQYKQFPEYQQVNAGMTLSEFKQIYFWEYLHRLIGRFIGLAFIGPFLWFWYRGSFDKKHFKKLTILFLLGASQGIMGWIMVKSGLVDVPYVSHYRLALHLVLAFILFGYCVWLGLDFYRAPRHTHRAEDYGTKGLMGWMYGIAGLLMAQVIWGAFVAGLKAGHIYNTFPLMNESLMPRKAWALEPLVLNFIENPGLVQWSHRIIGTILVLAVILFWIRLLMRNVEKSTQYKVFTLSLLIIGQYVLGVFTLLQNVPIVLGVAHQVMALLIWGAWIVLYYEMKRAKK